MTKFISDFRWISRVAVILVGLAFCASGSSAQTAKKPGEAVTLKSVTFNGQARPGSEIGVVFHFLIEKGHHVQANPTSEPNFIPVVLKMEPASGVTASPVQYPAAKEEKIEGLAKPIRVYEETFDIEVPIKLGSDAALPLSWNGILTYQACKGATCFPPRKLKVEAVLKQP